MSEDFTLEFGHIKENDDVVVYEITRAQTKLVEPEQLDELKRVDEAFFKCQHYIVDEKFVRILYKRETGYSKLDTFKNANKQLKNKIARHMLNAVDMLGTQYTTLIHPANIYVNEEGNVKYAHRGIRSVLPPKELALPDLLKEIKKVIIYLYTSYRFSELNKIDLNQTFKNDPFVTGILNATSTKQIKEAVSRNQPKLAMKDSQSEQAAKDNKASITKDEKDSKGSSPIALIVSVLGGMIVAVIVMYAFVINPQNNKNDSLSNKLESEKAVHKEEIGRLEADLKDKETVVNAYHAVVQEEPERAVSLFESLDTLDDSDEITLIDQYLRLNTIDSLSKILERDDSFAVPVVERLVKLDNKEANEIIKSIESSEPQVIIEQAWLDQAYSDVIEAYEMIPDNDRAKYLGALSYLEKEDSKKALALANDLNNKELKILSHEMKIKLIEKDKKLDKDKKKEEIDKINKTLKKLKK